MTLPHAHPSSFRLERTLDPGWGEFACVYVWENGDPAEATPPDSERCFLYEVTLYSCDGAEHESGYLLPPDPPFVGWRLRNPTDGRTGPVGLERFAASVGRAWDPHKLPGPIAPPHSPGCWSIRAIQEYRLHCEICGFEGRVTGPDAGPHEIVRTLRSTSGSGGGGSGLLWRYEITKHGRTAWMEFDGSGYLADSARIGFGPSWIVSRFDGYLPPNARQSDRAASSLFMEVPEGSGIALPNHVLIPNGPNA